MVDLKKANIVRGRGAVTFWRGIFEGILPFGHEIASLATSGDVVIGALDVSREVTESLRVLGWDGDSLFFKMVPKMVPVLARKLRDASKDDVSYRWLMSPAPGVGRVLIFFQGGSFLLNLNLAKDPTVIKSYWVEPGSLDVHREYREAAKDLILPPVGTSLHNLEVNVMSVARFAVAIGLHEVDPQDRVEALSESLYALGYDVNQTARLHLSVNCINWSLDWRANAFARLELGHRLGAALLFTDVEEPVQAPWSAWSLILPDGLLGEFKVQRIWCVGDTPKMLHLKYESDIITLRLFGVTPEDIEEALKGDACLDATVVKRALPLIQNLIRGVCLALSNPSEWRKGDWHGRPSGSPTKKGFKHKQLPVGERYVLGHPVKIDLREEVLQHIRTGRVGGGSPTKLFLVRGHWRNQAHGERLQKRRRQWIEPFWKGPEDARVLLRPYQT